MSLARQKALDTRRYCLTVQRVEVSAVIPHDTWHIADHFKRCKWKVQISVSSPYISNVKNLSLMVSHSSWSFLPMKT